MKLIVELRSWKAAASTPLGQVAGSLSFPMLVLVKSKGFTTPWTVWEICISVGQGPFWGEDPPTVLGTNMSR